MVSGIDTSQSVPKDGRFSTVSGYARAIESALSQTTVRN